MLDTMNYNKNIKVKNDYQKLNFDIKFDNLGSKYGKRNLLQIQLIWKQLNQEVNGFFHDSRSPHV